MRKITLPIALLATALIPLMHVLPAQAQTRVFVAAQGSDSNACTFAAPCRTFQHAHDVVAANGEIDVLDPAGYGTLTITKAISIQGHGFAGLAVPSGDGITINASANDKVNLRGLLLDGVGTGNSGIIFNSGASLNVQESVIRNFVKFGMTAGAATFVSNTLVDSCGYGLYFPSGGSGLLDHVELVNNGDALLVQSNAQVMMRDSILANNFAGAVMADSNAVLWITRSTFTKNNEALSVVAGGQIISFGDNSLAGNNNDGAPTKTIPLQ